MFRRFVAVNVDKRWRLGQNQIKQKLLTKKFFNFLICLKVTIYIFISPIWFRLWKNLVSKLSIQTMLHK